ncbi:putative transposase [Azospirillum oryzae]|uniref:Putative transposase n=1 Tax=Azospirillum oryzae TaxID=286727 RepID=A0A1X7EXP7_9PROT|nr:RNA-guided endonuclease TnpB family protein [Azospirillum oryzae]SMF41686.1 putative transposase [Azospirillum oryzae]
MPPVNRRVTYKLYPSVRQAVALERVCDLHRALYNAALEERIEAHRKAGLSIRFADQCKSLTVVRRECPEYLALNAQSAQVTLKRLDKAFAAFFRRVRAGQTPGFPRFKGEDRFPGFGFKTHGDGFSFKPGDNWRHGRLRLSGIGTMEARGEARTPGRIVCADVQRKADGWFLSLVVECEPHRERSADRDCGLDWGVETFATLAYGPDAFAAIPNDRHLNAEADAIKERQRDLSKALRGKRSKRAARARCLIAKRHRKVANRRKNFLHQTTARLVRDHKTIVTEALTVKTMAATARGTEEAPGKHVKQKAGLNRAILDTAPGSFIAMLAYKAEEAGCELIMLNTQKCRPSQTDPFSGDVLKKPLSQRTHTLADGRVIGRDEAAALVMLRVGLKQLGREPTWAVRSETPTTAA